MKNFDKIYKVILQSITDDDYDKFYERVDAAEELIDSIIAKYVNDQKMMEKFVFNGMDIDYDENCRSDKTGIACLIIDGAIEEMLDHPSEFFIEGRKDKDYLEIEAYTNDFGEELPDMFGKVWGHENLIDQYQDGGLDFMDVKRRIDRIGLGPVVDKWFAELGPQDDEQDQDDIDINSVNKKVSKKKVIKEDTNPDVQDQADCLNGFIEDHPEIDWEYAADYELDCVLNTCLFYLNDDAENAWPKCHFSEFATDEWNEEEDDHVYVSGEEVFRDAYRYKFCCGIFYLADELYDFVMKYANGDDKAVAEIDAMRNDDPDIVYVDWEEEGADDPDFQTFVDKCVGYLGNLCGKFSDIDRVKFDVLRQIASEIR